MNLKITSKNFWLSMIGLIFSGMIVVGGIKLVYLTESTVVLSFFITVSVLSSFLIGVKHQETECRRNG